MKGFDTMVQCTPCNSTVMRLCMSCGVVYVAKVDINTMKKEMEVELSNE